MTRQTEANHLVPITGVTGAHDLQAYCDVLLSRLSSLGYGRHQPLRTLGLTSCTSGEGVTTIAVNLAIQAASAGLNVLLVDANLRSPSIDRFFCVDRSCGLADALSEDSLPRGYIQNTEVAKLSVLTAGTATQSPAMQDPAVMSRLLGAVKDEFDFVVFDLPAAGHARHCNLDTKLDGLLLVLEAERVRHQDAEAVKDELSRSGVNLLGAVLNKWQMHVPDWLYRKI